MIVLLLATACTADAQAFSPATTQPKPTHDPRSADAVGASRTATVIPDELHGLRLRADALIDKAPVDTAPPPTTTVTTAPHRITTFCSANLDSLKSLLHAIESRRHQIVDDLGSGDVSGAQSAYDVIRWATEDLTERGRALMERCSEFAAEAAAEAQVTVGMAQAAWQAAESDCRARFAQQGLDCA